MRRRGLSALVVAALGMGLFVAHTADPVHADTSARITNISVAVAGTTATYSVCLLAPSGHTPAAGNISITSAGHELHAGFSYSGLTCGAGTYYLQAKFTGLSGPYLFDTVCILLNPDSAGNPAPAVNCLNRTVGLGSNFSGQTVPTQCQVDFDTSSPASARNCTGAGAMGSLTNPTPMPTATAPPTNTPTATNTATATNTPTATATNTPPPTATTANSTGGGPGPAATATPTQPTVSGTGATATPTATTGTTTGGGTPATSTPTHTAVAEVVVVQNPPGDTPAPNAPSAGSVGPAPTTKRHTTPTHMAAFTLRARLLAALVQPGATQYLAISSRPNVRVQVRVTFPGQRAFSVVKNTDRTGQLTLALRVPSSVPLRGGRAVATVVVSAASGSQHASVNTPLTISDMLLNLVAGRIVRCQQTQTVHVSYRPNMPLRILLLFPHNRQLPLVTRTDRHGNATVQATVAYVKASSPLQIGVQASATAARVQRTERLTVNVSLPQACQKATPSTVTVGS